MTGVTATYSGTTLTVDFGKTVISNQGLTDMEGGPAAGQTQTIQGDGGSNNKIIGILQENHQCGLVEDARQL